MDAEIAVLARLLAESYATQVAWRCRELKETFDEADRQVRAPDDPEWQRRVMTQPPDQLTWSSLSMLIEANPEAGYAVWDRVKAEAQAELESGHRAALAFCWDDAPWQRARFLAIRHSFIDEWQPRGGIELTLIDQMAQAHSLYLFWVERAHVQASLEGRKQKRDLSETGRWQVRTLGVAESLDQTAAMADRWQRLFVRALRALRDLRRHASPVVLAAPGSQVNLGMVQSNSTGTRSDG